MTTGVLEINVVCLFKNILQCVRDGCDRFSVIDDTACSQHLTPVAEPGKRFVVLPQIDVCYDAVAVAS